MYMYMYVCVYIYIYMMGCGNRRNQDSPIKSIAFLLLLLGGTIPTIIINWVLYSGSIYVEVVWLSL
jgi:hypothetical protein